MVNIYVSSSFSRDFFLFFRFPHYFPTLWPQSWVGSYRLVLQIRNRVLSRPGFCPLPQMANPTMLRHCIIIILCLFQKIQRYLPSGLTKYLDDDFSERANLRSYPAICKALGQEQKSNFYQYSTFGRFYHQSTTSPYSFNYEVIYSRSNIYL